MDENRFQPFITRIYYNRFSSVSLILKNDIEGQRITVSNVPAELMTEG
jgi:hypothetical protein